MIRRRRSCTARCAATTAAADSISGCRRWPASRVRADGITLLNAYDDFAAHALVVRFTRLKLRAAGVVRPDGPLAFLLAP